jgi:tRNA-specific 2-thiouridylase
MNDRSRVVVAMSGGVDSSVAAALLVEQGYQVIGMMLRLWSETGSEADNRCCTPQAMALARRIAARLDIPFYAVDARQAFHQAVVTYFLDGYAKGITPNPCLVCNRQVRWTFLLNQALALGADFMATGHYARINRTPAGGVQLLRALDDGKDQSYVLHVLDQHQLAHALFPLGEFTKSQVRQMARDLDLPVAERPDSQDLCFLGKGDYRDFLRRNSPTSALPGPILNRRGEQIGRHQGLAFYTIGQRKGLQVIHPSGATKPAPVYVLKKDLVNNALIVGSTEELGKSVLNTLPVHWISGTTPEGSFRAQVKIRYRSAFAWGTVTPQMDGAVAIRFDDPLRDITPGQAAVMYAGEVVLGGGIIR